MIPTRRALAGRRVVVTRSADQSRSILEGLRRHGAEAVTIPVIAIETVADGRSVRTALDRLASHPGRRYAVFASANGVRQAAAAVGEAGLTAGLAGVSVAAVGPATARALTAAGVGVDVVPADYVAESLASALGGRLRGALVWVITAEGARDVLRPRLEAAGATVDMLVLYRSVLPPEAGPALRHEVECGFDAVTLTSGRCAEHLARALGGAPLPPGAITACIGPVTEAAARREGLAVGVVARQATAEALVEALVDHFRRPLP